MDNRNDLISTLTSSGCSQKQAAIAFQVYVELCEIKKYWDITYSFNADRNFVYLTARKQESEPLSTFIPVPANEKLSFTTLQEFTQTNTNTYLVLVGADLTCVYYELSKGLAEPTDTTPRHLSRGRQHIIDYHLQHHRKLLENSALTGTPISIPIPNCETIKSNERIYEKTTHSSDKHT